MIFDSMKEWHRYADLYPRFREGFGFIEKAMKEDYPAGTYEISGRDLYAAIQEYETRPAEKCLYEGHEQYIDIQYILSGCERMDVTDRGDAVLRTPYDGARDVAFYENGSDAAVLLVDAGKYAVFFPNDIHKPGQAPNGVPGAVRKIVVKVRVSERCAE